LKFIVTGLGDAICDKTRGGKTEPSTKEHDVYTSARGPVSYGSKVVSKWMAENRQNVKLALENGDHNEIGIRKNETAPEVVGAYHQISDSGVENSGKNHKESHGQPNSKENSRNRDKEHSQEERDDSRNQNEEETNVKKGTRNEMAPKRSPEVAHCDVENNNSGEKSKSNCGGEKSKTRITSRELKRWVLKTFEKSPDLIEELKKIVKRQKESAQGEMESSQQQGHEGVITLSRLEKSIRLKIREEVYGDEVYGDEKSSTEIVDEALDVLGLGLDDLKAARKSMKVNLKKLQISYLTKYEENLVEENLLKTAAIVEKEADSSSQGGPSDSDYTSQVSDSEDEASDSDSDAVAGAGSKKQKGARKKKQAQKKRTELLQKRQEEEIKTQVKEKKKEILKQMEKVEKIFAKRLLPKELDNNKGSVKTILVNALSLLVLQSFGEKNLFSSKEDLSSLKNKETTFFSETHDMLELRKKRLELLEPYCVYILKRFVDGKERDTPVSFSKFAESSQGNSRVTEGKTSTFTEGRTCDEDTKHRTCDKDTAKHSTKHSAPTGEMSEMTRDSTNSRPAHKGPTGKATAQKDPNGKARGITGEVTGETGEPHTEEYDPLGVLGSSFAKFEVQQKEKEAQKQARKEKERMARKEKKDRKSRRESEK